MEWIVVILITAAIFGKFWKAVQVLFTIFVILFFTMMIVAIE